MIDFVLRFVLKNCNTPNFLKLIFFVFVFKCSGSLQHLSYVCRKGCSQIVNVYFYERHTFRTEQFRKLFIGTGLIANPLGVITVTESKELESPITVQK